MDHFFMAFSSEELFVLCLHLKITAPVGFDPGSWEEMPEGEFQAAMRTAEQDLLARGCLVPTENGEGLRVAKLVHAALHACAEPETTLVIQQRLSDDTEKAAYFHTALNMFIAHTIPVAGIHQFFLFKTIDAMMNAMWPVMRLADKPSPFLSTRLLDETLLQAAQAAGQGGFEAARSVLVGAQVREPVAQSIAQALVQREASSSVIFYKAGKEPEDQAEGFTLFQSRESLWMICPDPENLTEKTMIMEVTSPGQVQKTMQSFYQPAKENG